MFLIRTHLANHIRASSREKWLHQQARHMTAPDRNRHHARKCLTARLLACAQISHRTIGLAAGCDHAG
jgi:hypothetical protein